MKNYVVLVVEVYCKIKILKKSGYLPSSALKKALESDDNEVYCQRCFRLRHYNEIMPVEENNDDFLALLNSISQKRLWWLM